MECIYIYTYIEMHPYEWCRVVGLGGEGGVGCLVEEGSWRRVVVSNFDGEWVLSDKTFLNLDMNTFVKCVD